MPSVRVGDSLGNQPERALADYNEAIRRNPKSPQLSLSRAGIWQVFSEYEKALSDFRAAVQLDPEDVEAVNGLAWILCTCPNDSIRNGAEAVRQATSANGLSGWKEPMILDALAAAYAETGEFDKAVSWQRRAAELAPDEHKEDFRSRPALYKARTPFREAPSKPE